MLWLSKQPSWTMRNVQISTANFGIRSSALQFADDGDTPTGARKLSYLPATSESYTIWWNYRWMRITRVTETTRGWYSKEILTLSIFSRDKQILNQILLEAKSQYLEAQKDCITVYVSDSSNSWRDLATRPKRPLQSIILDPGIQELVVEDAKDFLASKAWYSERGIPFRRGYLLYGAPGSGKTSLIHSIAGELGLDVYILTLSRAGLDDTSLSELISTLPERCIALMEDIDAAFHHGLSRESKQPSASKGTPNDLSDTAMNNGPPETSPSRVSLSGLLNALDGIGAQEGRILFATTNKYATLDPALCRPGRMDLHIEFKLASQYQAEELFKRFYAPSPAELAAEAMAKKTESGTAQRKSKNASVDSGFDGEPSNDLIDLDSSSSSPSSASSSSSPSSDDSEKSIEPHMTLIGVSHRARTPKLSSEQVAKLAQQFAAGVPDRQLSMASLQGFLMTHKTRPYEAVAGVATWAEKERAEKVGQQQAKETAS
ncbi:P-loop containing nucleoside triphosphate hydrolase protein [Phlebopus sp. FC_14]|nr:P-loop containing nucleoside triphosphate hydrolase protein [Phlebopus sp. FC_14]